MRRRTRLFRLDSLRSSPVRSRPIRSTPIRSTAIRWAAVRLAAVCPGALGLVAAVATALATLIPGVAHADERARAREDYRIGLEHFQKGQHELALDFFMRSRRLKANAANTANAAWTLQKLRRDDEAYALFREVVTRFPAQLSSAHRAWQAPGIGRRRSRIG